MTRIKSTLCAAMALTFAAGTAVPATAAPIFVPRAPAASDNIINVQMSRKERRERRAERRKDRREVRRERRKDRREARRDRRRDRFERRGGYAYYHGHRGYRHHRPGYREYNGWWFPLAAFAAGAIITGAIDNDRSYGSAHVRWCYDRYRSYREWDNTFQPYEGPRRQCYSPYS